MSVLKQISVEGAAFLQGKAGLEIDKFEIYS